MPVSTLLCSLYLALVTPTPELFAVGSEPFWTLKVDAESAEIRLDRAGEPPLVFPYVAARSTPGRLAAASYFARSADDRYRIAITVSERACTDAASGNRYARTVALELNGRLYAGCGK